MEFLYASLSETISNVNVSREMIRPMMKNLRHRLQICTASESLGDIIPKLHGNRLYSMCL